MRLPIELYSFIFRCLGLTDLVRLRRVSKLWKSEIDRIRIKELVISCDEIRKHGPKKWSTGESINPASLIEMDVFDKDYKTFRKYLTTVHFLSDLKCLRIESFHSPDLLNSSFYQCLTKFRSLELLEIEYKLDERSVICHPNLKRLFISFVEGEQFLEIDCPRLKELNISGYCFSMDVIHPEVIEHLTTDFNDDDMPQLDLKAYESLESLKFSDSFRPINLTDHPKLKLVVFDACSLVDYDDAYYYRAIRGRLVNLLGQKKKLRRSDLAIYFGDQLLTNAEQFAEIDKELYEKHGWDPEESDDDLMEE